MNMPEIFHFFWYGIVSLFLTYEFEYSLGICRLPQTIIDMNGPAGSLGIYLTATENASKGKISCKCDTFPTCIVKTIDLICLLRRVMSHTNDNKCALGLDGSKKSESDLLCD